MSRSQFNYYMELFDPQDYKTDEETFENDYKVVSFRDSGVQLYIPMLELNFAFRKNWFKLTKNQAKMMDKIDFCFTNLIKLQTKSIVTNRIFLDTDHFISDKLYYYKKFKGEEFCPAHISVDDIKNKTIDENDDFFDGPLILKSGDGYSSFGIKIIKKYSEKEIDDHIENWKKLKNWTLSKIYIAKLWNNIICTNRIYYLVKKLRINNKIIVTGYWYDEFICYRSKKEYRDIKDLKDDNDFFDSYISNFDDTSSPFEFFNTRTVKHSDYVKIFTFDEYQIVKQKITKHLDVITKKIFSHITCPNDYEENYNDEYNRNVTFHLYGIDSIITDNLDIKIVEINGAPLIRDFDEEFFNYKRMLDEILKLTVDVLYKPKENVKYNYDAKFGKFKGSDLESKFCDMKFIECGEYTKDLKIPVYFSKTIYNTYPFILNGFFNESRSNIFQRIKNPNSDKIHLFYGQRDLYIRDRSSNNYYDELLEWNKSKCARNAKILNKIQGITFFLASKDKLYDQMCNFDFVPESILYELGNDTSEIQSFISNIVEEHLIVKPVFGSQGKGITILEKGQIDILLGEMKKVNQTFGYKNFIISRYINNPKLYDEKKFNLRFYVLININKLATFVGSDSDVQYYILKDAQVYFSMLPYNTKIESIANEINKISNKTISFDEASNFSACDIQNLIHITNLQIIKNMSKRLDTNFTLSNFVNTLDNLNYDNDYIRHIKLQAQNIIDKTINLVKYDIRPLNRFIKNSSAFNLIAYDTMIDDNNMLHLIEINRGPDLHGLKLTLGTEKITNIFSEIFDITVDNKKNNLKYFDRYDVAYC